MSSRSRTNDTTSGVLLGDVNLDPTRLPEFVKNAKDKACLSSKCLPTQCSV